MTLEITQINGRIGASVSGIALAQQPDEKTVQQIWTALFRHKVLFFADQHDLDDAGLVALGQALGTPTETAHPTAPGLDRYPQISPLDSVKEYHTDHWHTDATFVHAPPVAGVLQPKVLPEYGGDTLWANTASAYASLPGELQALADELWAVHGNRHTYADARAGAELPPLDGEDPDAISPWFRGRPYESIHPVVQVHPGSGESALLLGTHARHLLGLDAQTSQEIWSSLQEHIEHQENIVRWRWSLGDVAIFDNRTTQHYAVDDYDGQRRILHRVSLQGPPPVGIDGRSSWARVGDVSDYAPVATVG